MSLPTSSLRPSMNGQAQRGIADLVLSASALRCRPEHAKSGPAEWVCMPPDYGLVILAPQCGLVIGWASSGYMQWPGNCAFVLLYKADSTCMHMLCYPRTHAITAAKQDAQSVSGQILQGRV